MIRANSKELESIKSTTKINGIKVILTCNKCARRWAYWFTGEEDLAWNLPENWYVCSNCSKGGNHENN